MSNGRVGEGSANVANRLIHRSGLTLGMLGEREREMQITPPNLFQHGRQYLACQSTTYMYESSRMEVVVRTTDLDEGTDLSDLSTRHV